MKILAISGSLRRASSNTTILRAATTLVPDDAEISLYLGLRNLPPFDPDLEGVNRLPSQSSAPECRHQTAS